MKSKLKKSLILGVSGIALLGIGLVGGSNPSIQNSVQKIENYVNMPVSYADKDNTFDLSKRITSKQFTVDNNDGDTETLSTINKEADKKANKYLYSVNNLANYNVHISRVTTQQNGNASNCMNSETITITFIRK